TSQSQGLPTGELPSSPQLLPTEQLGGMHLRVDKEVLCLDNIPLDMSENSVDDQYINCNPPKVLPRESSGYIPVPTKYKARWEIAKKHWTEVGKSITDLTPMQGTAIVAYMLPTDLTRDFNKATREAGISQESYSQFAFKDFFFLLTTAVQARKGNCREVFRGVRNVHFNVRKGDRIRFGQFTSSSSEKGVAETFGTDTVFSIKTCYRVPIDDISPMTYEKEILIPPYETFVVRSKDNVSPIRLESDGVYSRFNCERLQ
ncbi:erythroblast NAD(P)(+)--arginine ADP-ribosyltransferase-like, partial [Crotalus tigris]|uniref:erythroblast NAD(P)(+)--arginine ADP-ribosyltransferase-like n=1 Tax=Crotalus tigris TaxID=88082 RepID=UPI00192F9BA1